VKILTLADAAEIVPLSRRTLYRVATRGDGPFRKREGRWLTTEADLIEWVRSGEKGGIDAQPDPMPRTRVRSGRMMEQVRLRREQREYS
jgi:hypothetical protein